MMSHHEVCKPMCQGLLILAALTLTVSYLIVSGLTLED